MSMSRYNRENPFMYLYEKKQSELEQASTIAVKEMVVMCTLAIISLIGCVIHGMLYQRVCVTELIMITMITVFIIFETLRAVSIVNKNSQELNYMLFGDNYQNINLNNEKLLVDINFYNECIGRVIFMCDSIRMYCVLYSVLIAYYIIKIMAYIIGGI